MKIAVYALCTNEQPFIKAFVEAARDADLIQVADAGSTDGSVAGLRGLGATVRGISIRPWRMDDARNVALALLPHDIDVCVALDLDAMLLPGWRAALETAWVEGTLLAQHPVIAGRDAAGAPRLKLDTRAHARHGARWKGPCYEYLTPDRSAPNIVRLDSPLVETPPGVRGRPETLLALLKLGAENDPTDARMSHRYGRALQRAGQTTEALAELQRCLTLPGLGAEPEERNATLRLIGLCHALLGAPAAARRWLTQATEEAPDLRGAWIDLACAYYQQAKWGPCLRACARAIAAPARLSAYDVESESGAMPEDLASVAAWRMGRRQEALDYARRAVALSPQDPRLAAALQMMEREALPVRR
jgi:tetratricopeptide (TPR) repeat protein